MTREEAIALMKEPTTYADRLHIITRIYEDIGSCSECQYWDKIGACTKQHFNFITYDDYYCADFERQTNDG